MLVVLAWDVKERSGKTAWSVVPRCRFDRSGEGPTINKLALISAEQPAKAAPQCFCAPPYLGHQANGQGDEKDKQEQKSHWLEEGQGNAADDQPVLDQRGAPIRNRFRRGID